MNGVAHNSYANTYKLILSKIIQWYNNRCLSFTGGFYNSLQQTQHFTILMMVAGWENKNNFINWSTITTWPITAVWQCHCITEVLTTPLMYHNNSANTPHSCHVTWHYTSMMLANIFWLHKITNNNFMFCSILIFSVTSTANTSDQYGRWPLSKYYMLVV